MSTQTGQAKSNLATVVAWLQASSTIEPVSSEWVPGATVQERRQLAKLGAVVAAVVGKPDNALSSEFSSPSLRAWFSPDASTPQNVIIAAKELASEQKEHGLAALYSELVSAQSRRTLGTFFTPAREVDWMLEQWSLNHPDPQTIIDVGAGVGIFTTAAAHSWPNGQVWAIDINPITLGLLVLRIFGTFPLVDDENTGPGIRVALADFTMWMEDTWPRLGGRRLILGNPPYTRLQLLPRSQRERLTNAAGGLCGPRASLSATITAQSLLSLENDDGLSLLLPAQWLEADYAEALREHLWALAHRRITMRLFDDGLFDDATVDAVALIVGPMCETEQPIDFYTSEESEPHTVLVRGECPAEFRSMFTRAPKLPALVMEGRAVLGDALTVRRGVATGANSYFAPTLAHAKDVALPSEVQRPLIRRLFGAPDLITNESLAALGSTERYVLVAASSSAVAKSAELARYISEGEEAQLHERHLCRSRHSWHDLTSEIFQPDLIIGQSTRARFRIVENAAGAAILNNLYGMTWRAHVDQDTRARLVSWLRSDEGQAALRLAARTHGSKLLKLEPRGLSRMPLPPQFDCVSAGNSGDLTCERPSTLAATYQATSGRIRIRP